MSRTDKDNPPALGGKWTMWSRPYANEHAPSWWKRLQRREERRKARQAFERGEEPHPRYERPYYW